MYFVHRGLSQMKIYNDNNNPHDHKANIVIGKCMILIYNIKNRNSFYLINTML